MRGSFLLLLSLMGCVDQDTATYSVDIRWTSHGVPHIQADDYGSLAYGMGYAMTRDNGCVLADQIVKTNSERSKYFGPGEGDANIRSDFGWKALDVRKDAEELWEGLAPRYQELLIGYAAGVSRAYADGDFPSQCEGEAWVKPIDHLDLFTYILALGLDGSGKNFVGYVADAQHPDRGYKPPRGGAARTAEGGDPLANLRATMAEINSPKRGSNGWAIGADRSASGGGMLLSNTHFPAWGEKRWHESHLTIPGELDIYGTSLVGVPMINMGFTEHVAWTHTVSFAPRFSLYMLSVDPEDPTRYLYDGEYRQMTSSDYSIEVLQEDGTLATEERTYWRSHYGPILNVDILKWTPAMAFTYRDVNERNVAMLDTWFGMAQATNLQEFEAAHAEHQGIPWVYTIAAFPDGTAWFGDTSRVPYLSFEAVEGWENYKRSNLFAGQLAELGLMLLDGADPLYTWIDDDAAAVPGTIPFERAPVANRTDFVFNSNDSHWLTHPDEPLEGYNPLYGGERTPRSARTRMNASYLAEQGAQAASGDDALFDLQELEAAALGMRSVIAERALEGVLEHCFAVGEISHDGGPYIDVGQVCDVLAEWDGTYRADAEGAVLWREFLGSGVFDVSDLNAGGGGLFDVPFNWNQPLSTPNTVIEAPEDPEDDPIVQALVLAARTLDDVGIPRNAALADVQYMPFADGTEIGVPGGTYWEGTIGIADWSTGATSSFVDYPERPELVNGTTELTVDGYPMNNGNSWMMAMAYEDDGPRARAVMTYSQSDDMESPHYVDQTELYARGEMRDVLFDEEAIAADVVEALNLVGGVEVAEE